jgi:hypothetical protein
VHSSADSSASAALIAGPERSIFVAAVMKGSIHPGSPTGPGDTLSGESRFPGSECGCQRPAGANTSAP